MMKVKKMSLRNLTFACLVKIGNTNLFIMDGKYPNLAKPARCVTLYSYSVHWTSVNLACHCIQIGMELHKRKECWD